MAGEGKANYITKETVTITNEPEVQLELTKTLDFGDMRTYMSAEEINGIVNSTSLTFYVYKKTTDPSGVATHEEVKDPGKPNQQLAMTIQSFNVSGTTTYSGTASVWLPQLKDNESYCIKEGSNSNWLLQDTGTGWTKDDQGYMVLDGTFDLSLIHIFPGTAVDYPVVYAEDNEKYMDTSFDGEGQASGTIFLDYESQRDFSGKHNIIYGHNMKNGSMFHDIVRFKEQDYFKDHQYGVLYTPERTIYLKMISAYYGEALPVYRKTEFATEEDFDLFLDAVIYPCEFGERPKERPESLYTFITCSYEFDDARTYLHGVEIPEQEAREALGIQTEK